MIKCTDRLFRHFASYDCSATILYTNMICNYLFFRRLESCGRLGENPMGIIFCIGLDKICNFCPIFVNTFYDTNMQCQLLLLSLIKIIRSNGCNILSRLYTRKTISFTSCCFLLNFKLLFWCHSVAFSSLFSLHSDFLLH